MRTAHRLLLVIAAATLPAGHAVAQMPWPGDPPPQGGTTAPWPGTAPPPGGGGMLGPPPGGGMAGPPRSPTGGPPPGGGMPPCMAEFIKLRDEFEKRGKAMKEASQRKPRPGQEEMCRLYTTFSDAGAKWAKYVETNVQACGIPAQTADMLKQMHVHTDEIRVKICNAPQGPAQGPSLHDALDTTGTRLDGKGSGIFESLSGPTIR